MSGYRESSFDPTAGGSYGRPLRPYNWVQWTGVGFILVGLAVNVAYFAGRLGWFFKPMATPTLAIVPIMLGITLVNSRREVLADPAPELAAARKRWLIIVTLLCVVVLGAATILDFKGA
jgi:hypothetical protein